MAKKLLEVWKEGDILLIKSKLAWLVEVQSETELTESDHSEIVSHILLYAETLDVPDNAVGWTVKYRYDGCGEGEVVDIEPLTAGVLATIDLS